MNGNVAKVPTNGFSIIVCCYNSARRIEKTLKHLFAQNVEGVEYEILLIDNNCTDNTVLVVEDFYNNTSTEVPLRIISQPIPGLSAAREKGIEMARYKYIILCDDDNWLCSSYVQTAYEVMENDLGIGVLGGQGVAIGETPLPYWFATYQGGYAVGVQALYSKNISDRGYVWGAGMVLRKEKYQMLKNAGFTNLLTDRNGKNLSSGGDSEICKWFLLAGYKLWYDERLIFEHFIPSDRLTKAYCEKLFTSFNESDKSLFIYNILINYQSSRKKGIQKSFSFFYYSIKFFLTLNPQYKFLAEAYSIYPLPLFSKEMHRMKKILNQLT